MSQPDVMYKIDLTSTIQSSGTLTVTVAHFPL